MELSRLLQMLESKWSSDRVEILPGVENGQIGKFEVKYDVTLPDDLRSYFRVVNGMRSGYTDGNWLEFFSIESVRTVPEELGDYGGIPDYREIVVTLPLSQQWFVLVSYLAHSHVYAIRLSPHRSSANDVIRICGSDYAPVASSWSDFLYLYYRDVGSLLRI